MAPFPSDTLSSVKSLVSHDNSPTYTRTENNAKYRFSAARRTRLADALLDLDAQASIPAVLELTRPDVADLKLAGED